MNRILSFIFFTVLITPWSSVIGQNCNNIGFEDGTTAGWQLSNGVVFERNRKLSFENESSGTFDSGHMLTNRSMGNDPLIKSEAIPMVAPGSKYSLRLGNKNVDSRFDRIRSTFLVTEENTLFQYKFAVVLEDPGHETYQQPGFRITVSSSKQGVYGCAYYEVAANQQIPGFKQDDATGLMFRNWTTGALDLSTFIGEQISIEITAWDCTESGHFGYAYIDATCMKMEISQPNNCFVENAILTLSAPDGFEKYAWSSGQTGKSITVPAIPGQKYTVNLRPFTTLSQSCDIQLSYVIPAATFSESHQSVQICEGEKFTLGSAVYTQSGKYVHKIPRPGLCDSLVTLDLTVIPKPVFIQEAIICEGDTFIVNGHRFYTSGSHKVDIPRSGLCDSTIVTELIVRKPALYTQNIKICRGEFLLVADSIYREAGSYRNVIKRPDACDSVVLTHLEIVAFDFTIAEEVTLIQGDSIQLLQPGSFDNYHFNWYPTVEISCDTCPLAWIQASSSTDYTLRISSEDYRCSVDLKTKVNVLGLCNVYLPSAFSPNLDDDINGIFYPKGAKCVKSIRSFQIYNRTGHLVYHVEDFPVSDPKYGWTGNWQNVTIAQPTSGTQLPKSLQNMQAPPGEYVYKLLYEYKSGKKASISGSVELIR